MAGKPGFWSEIHSSGVTNLEHAKQRIAAGEKIAAVERAMRGEVTGGLNAALSYAKKQGAKKEGLAAPKPPVQRTPAQERVAQGLRGMKPAEEEQPEEPEPPKPVKPADTQELSALDAAGAADLRAFIRYIGREKQAEVALGFAQFRQAG